MYRRLLASSSGPEPGRFVYRASSADEAYEAGVSGDTGTGGEAIRTRFVVGVKGVNAGTVPRQTINHVIVQCRTFDR